MSSNSNDKNNSDGGDAVHAVAVDAGAHVIPAEEEEEDQKREEAGTRTPPIRMIKDDDDPKPMGTNDIVLVPVNPRLSAHAPGIVTCGSRTHSQMDRRRRLFAAKTFLMEHSENQTRKKMVAYKSISTKGSAIVDKVAWEDLFKSPRKPKRRNSNNFPPSRHHIPVTNTPTTTAATRNPASNKPTTTNTTQAAKKQRTTGKQRSNLRTTNFNSSIPLQDHNKKSISTTTTTAKAPPVKPLEVYRGPPSEVLEGGWPQGWIKTEVQRKGGTNAGHRDRYWYSPGGKKFRSMVEIKKFMVALEMEHGNEDAAWKVFKSIQL